MALRFLFTLIFALVGIWYSAGKASKRRIGMDEASEQLQNERARSLLTDLTQLAWNRSRQDSDIETINVANIRLYDENNTIYFFYSGKLSYPSSPIELGNATLHKPVNATTTQMPFIMDTMQYVSQYWIANPRKGLNRIKANILGMKGYIEATKKPNSTESKLIVTDPGKFIYILNGELETLSSNIELGLHKEIITSFETST